MTTGDKVLGPDDYTVRSDVWSKMEVGDQVKFRAGTYVEYASVRGSAYAYGKRKFKTFRARRIDEGTVMVWREK